MVGVESRGRGGVRWRAGLDVRETGCGGSGVRSGYDPLPSLSPGPGSARAHNTQPQLEPAHASLGERKRLGGPNAHFCENLAGKRKTGLKGTEYSGSNTASKWGRSCPGTVPGLARTATWNKCLEPAPENCSYQSCSIIGENEAVEARPQTVQNFRKVALQPGLRGPTACPFLGPKGSLLNSRPFRSPSDF